MAPRRDSGPFRRALGEAIRARRLELDLSQEELAYQADLDRTYLSGLEGGARNPTLETLLRVAKALGLKASEMMGEAETGTPRRRIR